jgi:Antirepressor regulating drug resistance, predicted signal transduction N-terminal membrane component
MTPSPPAIALFLNAALWVTMVGLLVLFAVGSVLRDRPVLRHNVCLGGLIALLLIPVALCLPASSLVTLTLPAPSAPVPAPLPPGAESASPAAPSAVAGGREAALLLAVWGAGMVWGASRFALGWREARRLRRSGTPWPGAADPAIREPLERVLGPGALPPVCVSVHAKSPMAVGILRPVVLLPEGMAERLTPVQLRQVLLHECAHVAHRHALGGIVERLAGLLFWPHPLVWLVCRELSRAREEVCDAAAAREGGTVSYARTLLTVAQGVLPAPSASSPAFTLLGREVRLEKRVAGLLDPRRRQENMRQQGKPWPVVYGIGLILGLTALMRIAAPQQGGGEEAAWMGPDDRFLAVYETARARAAAKAETAWQRVDPRAGEAPTHWGPNRIEVRQGGAHFRHIPVAMRTRRQQLGESKTQEERAKTKAEARQRAEAARAEASRGSEQAEQLREQADRFRAEAEKMRQQAQRSRAAAADEQKRLLEEVHRMREVIARERERMLDRARHARELAERQRKWAERQRERAAEQRERAGEANGKPGGDTREVLA